MSSLLLLCEDTFDAAPLRAALASLPYRLTAEIDNPTQLASEISRVAADVIIACTHSPGEALLSALRGISERTPRPILMFANDARPQVIRKTVDAGVAAYVVDGWAPTRICAIVEAARARFDAYESLKKELRSTQAKLAERKVVEKAKGLVMQQRGLSEDQAYSALRKMAMDQNLTLAEVARRVISIAHLLA